MEAAEVGGDLQESGCSLLLALVAQVKEEQRQKKEEEQDNRADAPGNAGRGWFHGSKVSS